jgi:16S rRNA (guanine966-N2)-methyltransferase
MRIIAGSLGGRHFQSPRGHRTHPMSDKVRGALFNILGDLHGLDVLDAYAGSGALGYEAISRGAKNVLAIDIDKEAHHAIQANIQELGLDDRMQVLRKNISGWSKTHLGVLFDVVLADPPYDDVDPRILGFLTGHVRSGGLFVLSWPGGYKIPLFKSMEVSAHKQYGDAELIFYRKAPAS